MYRRTSRPSSPVTMNVVSPTTSSSASGDVVIPGEIPAMVTDTDGNIHPAHRYWLHDSPTRTQQPSHQRGFIPPVPPDPDSPPVEPFIPPGINEPPVLPHPEPVPVSWGNLGPHSFQGTQWAGHVPMPHNTVVPPPPTVFPNSPFVIAGHQLGLSPHHSRPVIPHPSDFQGPAIPQPQDFQRPVFPQDFRRPVFPNTFQRPVIPTEYQTQGPVFPQPHNLQPIIPRGSDYESLQSIPSGNREYIPSQFGGREAQISIGQPFVPALIHHYLTIYPHPDPTDTSGVPNIPSMQWDIAYPPFITARFLPGPTSVYPIRLDRHAYNPGDNQQVQYYTTNHVLRYWMDPTRWGPICIGGTPVLISVGIFLDTIYEYFHQPLTPEEHALVCSVPQNRQRIEEARYWRIRELAVARSTGPNYTRPGMFPERPGESGYLRSDVMGGHRRFYGVRHVLQENGVVLNMLEFIPGPIRQDLWLTTME